MISAEWLPIAVLGGIVFGLALVRFPWRRGWESGFWASNCRWADAASEGVEVEWNGRMYRVGRVHPVHVHFDLNGDDTGEND
jgi:hypothetical protein